MVPIMKHAEGAVMVWGALLVTLLGIYSSILFLSQPLSPPNCLLFFPHDLIPEPAEEVSALHRPSAQRCCAGGRCALVCVSVISLTAAR